MSASLSIAALRYALQRIAAFPLWGEPIADQALKKEYAERDEYDEGEDIFDPSCSTESDMLDNAVKIAREVLGADQRAPSGQRYEVQTRVGDQWQNCWLCDERPLTFTTRRLAKRAINELLADINEAVALGDMADACSPEDFRIVPLGASAAISSEPDVSSADRAAWANVAIESYRSLCRTDWEDTLVDLLTDLMHLADREHALNFESALKLARVHHAHERKVAQ